VEIPQWRPEDSAQVHQTLFGSGLVMIMRRRRERAPNSKMPSAIRGRNLDHLGTLSLVLDINVKFCSFHGTCTLGRTITNSHYKIQLYIDMHYFCGTHIIVL
jgi:hypothetical protein